MAVIMPTADQIPTVVAESWPRKTSTSYFVTPVTVTWHGKGTLQIWLSSEPCDRERHLDHPSGPRVIKGSLYKRGNRVREDDVATESEVKVMSLMAGSPTEEWGQPGRVGKSKAKRFSGELPEGTRPWQHPDLQTAKWRSCAALHC